MSDAVDVTAIRSNTNLSICLVRRFRWLRGVLENTFFHSLGQVLGKPGVRVQAAIQQLLDCIFAALFFRHTDQNSGNFGAKAEDVALAGT